MITVFVATSVKLPLDIISLRLLLTGPTAVLVLVSTLVLTCVVFLGVFLVIFLALFEVLKITSSTELSNVLSVGLFNEVSSVPQAAMLSIVKWLLSTPADWLLQLTLKLQFLSSVKLKT